MPALSALEREILRAAFHDGAMRVQDGEILFLRSKVVFSGNDYIRAFRSLRARNHLKWNGHSVTGGELYGLTDEGKEAFRSSPPEGAPG